MGFNSGFKGLNVEYLEYLHFRLHAIVTFHWSLVTY